MLVGLPVSSFFPPLQTIAVLVATITFNYFLSLVDLNLINCPARCLPEGVQKIGAFYYVKFIDLYLTQL